MRTASLTALALCALAACGSSDKLKCEDLLPPGQATFRQIAPMFVGPSSKSCSQCHNTTTPLYGYNFEGPGVTYDALTTHMAPIYEQLATGLMPRSGDVWSEDDLRLLRSWYCQGAFYESP